MTSLLHTDVLEALVEIAAAAPPGHFAELGVYQGGSAERLAQVARAQDRRLILFDTFTGIPFQGADDPHRVGDFADTSEAAVRALIPDATIVRGIFPASLLTCTFPIDLAPLAFVHVDADQYESLRAAIEHFPRFMPSGGVMVFDDYGCLDGATRAVKEWGVPLEFTRHGKAVWRKP